MLQLRLERKARGWSLAKVTGKTGISESNLSLIERDLIPAYNGWKRRIARAFGLPADDLFREPEASPAADRTVRP